MKQEDFKRALEIQEDLSHLNDFLSATSSGTPREISIIKAVRHYVKVLENDFSNLGETRIRGVEVARDVPKHDQSILHGNRR